MKPLSMIIIGQDADQRALARMHFVSSGQVQVVAETSDYSRSPELVGEYQVDSALLFTNGTAQSSVDLIQQLVRERPSLVVICTGTKCSTESVINFYRAGASEFLMQPLNQVEITQTLERILSARASTGSAGESGGSVFACYSYRGGAGSTTVGVNLAATLSRSFGKTVSIVDLNLQQGTVPIFLGIKPAFSIAEVVQNQDRLDAQLLKSFHTPAGENLYCMAAPIKIEDADDVEATHVEILLSMLQSQFDYVVVDCQHLIDATTVAVLRRAKAILLVTLLDMASVYTTRRTLEILRRMAIEDDRIRVLINRYTKDPDFPVLKIEQLFGCKIELTIGDDPDVASTALNLGSPIVISHPKSFLVKQYVELARALTGQSMKQERGSKGRFSLFR